MKKIPLLVALTVLALPLAAQDTPAPSKPSPSAPPLLSFEFPGGSLEKLVAMLAKAPGGPMNIIGDPADMSTTLPAFSLQNASPEIFGRSLGQFLESRGLSLVGSNLSRPENVKDVYIVRRIFKRTPGPDSFEPFQLGPYLEHQKIDDIIGAIRTAWELDPNHEPAALRLKFHPPTNILLASGPVEATQLAGKVISTMKRSNDHVYVPGEKPEPTPKAADKR